MRPACPHAPPLLFASLALAVGCATAPQPAEAPAPKYVGVPQIRELTDADRERFARTILESARALRRERRLEAAESVLNRGLALKPDHAGLHRERARLMAASGRTDQAAEALGTADVLDPPTPPPPDTPLTLPSHGVLLVLLPPRPDPSSPERTPSPWPDDVVARTLERRLHKRLPRARVVYASPQSVAAARRWLPGHSPRAVVSLRVDRAWCGDTIKDGRFSLSWLRVAAARPGEAQATRPEPEWVRSVVIEPRGPRRCEAEAVARALEKALALPRVRAALRAPDQDDDAWSAASIRALFPRLDADIYEEIAAGRALLMAGRVESAAEAFRRALVIDPDDADARSFLREAESTLALMRELSAERAEPEAGVLDPHYTANQRAAAEALLAQERHRRDDMLAALAVLDEDARLPDARVLARLRPAEIHEPEAFGPSLARRRAGAEVEARVAYGPGGDVLARYYFAHGADLPVVREDDTNGDGHPDRWVGYAGATRSEVWEDGRASGQPDVHLTFARGGAPLTRIDLDSDLDGRPDRIFHYSEGQLSAEARDSDLDGTLDTFDRFDTVGNVDLREEDLDGDGGIDVRSVFEEGRLVRRELASPDLAPDG